LQTGGTKQERVNRLITTWQEQGEIEKVLAGMAFQARKVELNAMDKVALYELCRKKGVDALSKEVLVDASLCTKASRSGRRLWRLEVRYAKEPLQKPQKVQGPRGVVWIQPRVIRWQGVAT